MSSRDITILIWALLGLTLLGLDLAGRRDGSRISTFGAAVRRVMRTASGRVGVLAAWLWVGLHFFSR